MGYEISRTNFSCIFNSQPILKVVRALLTKISEFQKKLLKPNILKIMLDSWGSTLEYEYPCRASDHSFIRVHGPFDVRPDLFRSLSEQPKWSHLRDLVKKRRPKQVQNVKSVTRST